jgi:hypothetical protein
MPGRLGKKVSSIFVMVVILSREKVVEVTESWSGDEVAVLGIGFIGTIGGTSICYKLSMLEGHILSVRDKEERLGSVVLR